MKKLIYRDQVYARTEADVLWSKLGDLLAKASEIANDEDLEDFNKRQRSSNLFAEIRVYLKTLGVW